MTKEIQLTDQQIDAIAERAAEVAFEKIYKEVGKSVLTKLSWMAGAAVIGLFIWFGSGHAK